MDGSLPDSKEEECGYAGGRPLLPVSQPTGKTHKHCGFCAITSTNSSICKQSHTAPQGTRRSAPAKHRAEATEEGGCCSYCLLDGSVAWAAQPQLPRSMKPLLQLQKTAQEIH